MKKILIILGILVFINVLIITVSKVFANEISMVYNVGTIEVQAK